jgi:CP family cyanate transporter-like MFS transporter
MTVRPGAPARASGFVLLALMLIALNLRGQLTSLPTVVDHVTADLGLSSAGVGLLTSIPILCFAVCTPAVSVVVGRIGPERAVLVAMTLVLAGTVLRSAGTVPAALVGTALLGVGITVGNVSVPIVIARDFRDRAATVTGMYAATMNVGSTFTTMLTVPLATAFGWQWALAGWGLLAVVALCVWVPAGRELAERHPDGGMSSHLPRGAQVDARERREVRRLAFLLAVAFAGTSSSYYVMTAWLPSILADRLGMDPVAAGAATGPFQLLAVVAAVLVPAALARKVSFRAIGLTLTLMWLSLPLALLLAPGLWWLGVALAGAAQGGYFTVLFTLLAERSPSVAAVRRGSAVVQTAGYAGAATAPTLIGAVHSATDGWGVPLAIITAVLAVMGAALWAASRPVR